MTPHKNFYFDCLCYQSYYEHHPTSIFFIIPQPGFLFGVLGKIKGKTSSMTPKQKKCALVLDEMSIKPHADYSIRLDAIEGLSDSGKPARQAMVFMVRGICGRWKQVRMEKYLNSTQSNDM